MDTTDHQLEFLGTPVLGEHGQETQSFPLRVFPERDPGQRMPRRDIAASATTISTGSLPLLRMVHRI